MVLPCSDCSWIRSLKDQVMPGGRPRAFIVSLISSRVGPKLLPSKEARTTTRILRFSRSRVWARGTTSKLATSPSWTGRPSALRTTSWRRSARFSRSSRVSERFTSTSRSPALKRGSRRPPRVKAKASAMSWGARPSLRARSLSRRAWISRRALRAEVLTSSTSFDGLELPGHDLGPAVEPLEVVAVELDREVGRGASFLRLLAEVDLGPGDGGKRAADLLAQRLQLLVRQVLLAQHDDGGGVALPEEEVEVLHQELLALRPEEVLHPAHRALGPGLVGKVGEVVAEGDRFRFALGELLEAVQCIERTGRPPQPGRCSKTRAALPYRGQSQPKVPAVSSP